MSAVYHVQGIQLEETYIVKIQEKADAANANAKACDSICWESYLRYTDFLFRLADPIGARSRQSESFQ